MARALLVAHRHAARFEGIEAFLDVLNRTLTPDNIVPRPPAVATADGVLTAIFNPSGATYLEGTMLSGVSVRLSTSRNASMPSKRAACR
jgi:hypothetical protein